MHKGLIAFVIVFAILLVVAYAYHGFGLLSGGKPGNSQYVTTSLQQSTTTGTTTTTMPSNYSQYVTPCNGFSLVGQQYNTTYTARCSSGGGTLGVWVSAGDSGTEHLKITGADGKTYVDQTSTYNCTAFLQNFTGPAQTYNITYTTGAGNGTCGNSNIAINGTTVPPILQVYGTILNANFSTGTYTGWNVTGAGFGPAPLNISFSESKPFLCYQGQHWANYNGQFFATTYACGINFAPGNLTSSLFKVNPKQPFLNFRIISPEDNFIYVQVLRANFRIENGQQTYINSTPVLLAHFNTYNISANPNATSTFGNVTIPLTPYINQILKVRVVSSTTSQSSDYIAVGDFEMSDSPHQDPWVATNITNLNG